MILQNIKENESLLKLNHSCAHLMAQAIKKLYPQALFWVGPVIDEGFYYDIDLGDDVISEEDFPIIEKEMKKLAKKNKLIKKEIITKEKARQVFADDLYKQSLLDEIEEDEVIVYRQDDFVDLCRGPHVSSTKELRYFKLLKASGAYFKGDSKNKMLQRIYGICFPSQSELDDYLLYLEEVKKRDHRKLGRDLDLFFISPYAPGSPIWLPNGMVIRKQLIDFWYQEHHKEGYVFIQTPQMLSCDLWKVSGHYENFHENMYFSQIEEKEYAIKPMNCPGGMLVYQNSIHSYRELPLRIGEMGIVHRQEASGSLAGLLRVRTITQDDAHIFMREEQLEDEIIRLIKFLDRIYQVFGLSYNIELSTRPEEKYIGSISVWDRAEKALAQACEKTNKTYKINEGDGAFYGPKLDFHINDAIGRSWQCGTIQLDMNLPERFDLFYIDEKGEKQRPIMIHRVIYGALERFIGVLIEHYAGAFPLWLSPMQISILPVNNQYHLDYAKEIYEKLFAKGFRVELDDREEKLSYKIREKQTKKVPYVLILGDHEKEMQKISYRCYGEQSTSEEELDKFIKLLEKQISAKK